MNTFKCFTIVLIGSLVILLPTGWSVPPGVEAKSMDEGYTFVLESSTVHDALRQVMHLTGVKINVKGHSGQMLAGKSYDAASPEQIIMDLCRQVNVAIEWRYRQDKLDMVFITFYEAQKGTQPPAPERKVQSDEAGTWASPPIRVHGRPNHPGTASVQQRGDPATNHQNQETQPSPMTAAHGLGHGAANATETAQATQKSGAGVKSVVSSLTGDTDAGSSTTTLATPPDRHGLEPPPMPPGFRRP